MSNEKGVKGCARDHAEDGNASFTEKLRNEAAVTDTKHVGQGLKQCPTVLLAPVRILIE